MVRVGICGFGGLGHGHANSVWLLDGVEVTAVCDINPEQLAKKDIAFNIKQEASQFDISTCRIYLDYRDMLAHENLDAMVIALPTDLHADYSIEAMRNGCHVLSEKPMALSVEDCSRMIEARDKHGRQLMIGQCLRFWPEYEYLLACIRDGRFGKLHSLIMERIGSYPSQDPTNWFMDHRRSGGAIIDLHVHDLDWVQMAFGKPKNISAIGVQGKTGGIDDITALLEYDDTAITIRGSWMCASGFHMGYKAIFEDATVDYSSSSCPTIIVSRVGSANPEVVNVDAESAYLREMRYFIGCVNGDHDNLVCPAESTRESISLVLQEQRIILDRKGSKL